MLTVKTLYAFLWESFPVLFLRNGLSWRCMQIERLIKQKEKINNLVVIVWGEAFQIPSYIITDYAVTLLRVFRAKNQVMESGTYGSYGNLISR